MFADLVGSTAFAERLDPEAVRAGLAPYFELLRSTVDDHAGTIVKFLGDGMLALFGVPEVAEDDALRAVTAAVELQRQFRSFADEIRGRHGVELGLRVGINTGELVVGTDDIDLVGDVLNTAARLEAACEPGSVLVGEDTWRLTRSSVSYEVLGEVRVKGKSEPVATFRVVDEDSEGVDEMTPFVGRASELAVLREVFDDAVGSSAARLATVIGDPGVGKTRLAQELRAASEARSFDLRLERRGSTTFAPIADLLREVTDSGSVDDVDRLVDGHPEAARLGPVLASFLGHSEQRTTEEAFWAVRKLLELLAADGPVIVVVDDIQWAEPLFWDLLEHLVEWTAAPVLLIALARPELRELRPELTQPGRRVSATLALEGLDAGTTLELAARLLGIDELPPELAERLPRSTDGNPLFVRELVQMLVDDGVLAREGDRWRLTIDADAIEVPPTILSLLASRVERLPDDERQVVELASVVGTEFDRGTLTAIASGDLAARLGAVIDRLRRKDLIEPTGQWAGDHPVYRFHHVLIRDAAYRRLLKGHRAELHQRVGRHVASTDMADDERDVIVAHHFEQVYQYRSELGVVDDETRDLAVDAATRLRSVAEQALAREDLASAGSAAIRALGLLEAGAGAERDELLLIGCEALLASADVARGAPLVDELHTRSADGRLAAWADCFRAQLWSLTAADRLTEAGELAAGAADRLTAIGDDAGVAKARLVRASCLARLGRVGDCEAELDLALGAARSAGDRRRTVAVLGAAPLAALWGPSPVARAGGRCLDVLRLLRITTASPTVEATSIRCQGMLEALRGRDEAARGKFETSRSIARELGLRHALYETELFAGLAELLAGDAVAAEPLLRAAHEGLGRLGIGADAGQAAALLARSILLQGRVAEASELATAALDTAGQNLQTAIAARAVLAEVLAAQRDHDAARVLVDEALSIVAPTDVTLDHALTLLAAARVAVARGDTDTSARHQAKATELLAAKGAAVAFDEAHLTSTADHAPSPSQVPDPAPATHRLWNEALEITHRSAEFAVAGDRASFTACYSPDLTFTTHRALPATLGFSAAHRATTWADFIEWLMSQGGTRVATVEPLAIRGRHHALYRTRVGSETGALDRLVVVRCDGHVVVDAHFFDPDQLVEAIDELDRQWVEHDPSAIPYSTLAAGGRMNAALATGDPEAMRALVTADFVAVDHRQAGLGERRLDSWIASNDMSATGHPFLAIATEILNGDDRRCLARIAASVGDDTWHTVSLMELRDGLVSRVEHFGDDIEAATARYRELANSDERGRRFTNTAWELGQLGQQAFARRDADQLRSLLAPGFRAILHDRLADAPLETDRDTFIDVLFDVDGDSAPLEYDDRLVAVRGDDLALAFNRSTSGGAEQYVRYRVIESVGHQVIGVEWFDEDQLEQAIAELDRRYLRAQGFAPDHWLARAWPAIYTTGAEALVPYLHADVEFVEHRRYIERAGGASALLEAADANAAGTAMIPQVFRVGEQGAMYERVEVEHGAPGELRMIVVLGFADDHVRHVEIFGPDELDAALARYDEIVGDEAPEAGRPRSNRAFRIADEFSRAILRRDRDAMLGMLADDFESHNRGVARAALGLEPRGDRAELVDRLLTVATEEDAASLTRTPLAIRGDDFYLAASSMATVNGDEVLNYALGECDGARLRRVTYYDDSQLDEALAELDRRYRLACGIDDDHWIAKNWDTLTSFDADRYDEIFAPDFRSFDHRGFTLGLTSRADLLAWVRATPASSNWSIPVIHRLDDRAMVLEHAEMWADASGESHMLAVLEFGDGNTTRIDTYDVDDLDAALSRYDEITRASRRRLTNHAWVIAQEAQLVKVSGDRDRFGAFFAEDFVVTSHDSIMAQVPSGTYDKALWLEVAFDPSVFGPTSSEDSELIAVRGDDRCLFRSRATTPSGDLIERLNVVKVRDGLAVQLDSFPHDQLREAQVELDRGGLTALGFAEDHPWFELGRLIYSAEWTTITRAFSEHIEFVDHRRVSFPDGGRSELRSAIETLFEAVEVVIPRILRLTDRLTLAERIEQTADGAEQNPGLFVMMIGADGQIERMEIFEVDDEAGAIACFDRLRADIELAESPGAAIPPLTNRAWEIASAFNVAYVAGDRAAIDRLVDPDGPVESRRRFTVEASGTARGFLDIVLGSHAEAGTNRQQIELVAVRGEHLCLVLVDGWYDDDNLRNCLVVETDDDRVTHMVWFDDDQLIDAQLELDRLWFESIGYR